MAMKGWFDAFREGGGPTLYAFHNRTPVGADAPTAALCAAAATLYIAFLVILPGIRKEKFSTFATVTLSLFVGTVILVCLFGSAWHVASTHAHGSYRAFSSERVHARIAVHVGLDHVNVTLLGLPRPSLGNASLASAAPTDVDFNERFSWQSAGSMRRAHRDALRRGLPYPILTVAEYFALAQEGFAWGGRYRAAGYYATILLWASLALWLLMNLLVVVVPRYGAYAAAGCGSALLATAAGYWLLLPSASPAPLAIALEGGRLAFHLGWCFWLVVLAGSLCLVCGVLVSIIDLLYPHKFSTILEVDYDTPYDRHVIIEDSHHTRARASARPQRTQNCQVNHSQALGSRILRRLSSKTRNTPPLPASVALAQECSIRRSSSGFDNVAFQHDLIERPPKSPWRYPLFRKALPYPLDRNDSTSSLASSAAGVKMSPAVHPSRPHRLRTQITTPERVHDVAMW